MNRNNRELYEAHTFYKRWRYLSERAANGDRSAMEKVGAFATSEPARMAQFWYEKGKRDGKRSRIVETVFLD